MQAKSSLEYVNTGLKLYKIPRNESECHCQQRSQGEMRSFVLIVWMDSGCVEIVRLLVTNNDKTGEQTHYGHYTRAGDLYISIILCSPPLLEGFSGV